MGKSIIIVGVFTEGSSNNGIVKSFRKLDWNVKTIPYRDLYSSIGIEAACWGIRNVASVFKPDLMLFCKFNGLPSEVISYCGKYAGLTCVWFMDAFNIVRPTCPELISHCHAADFSIHWPGVADEFRELNIKNVFGLVEGCDETEFYPVKTVSKYSSDISFIGTKNHRDVYVKALIDAGFKVKCYGAGYGEYVTGENFNAVCSSSKMVLNIPTNPGAREYFGDRIVRTLATKTISLTLNTPGLDKYFNNGEHLVWFDSVEDCVETAKKYINNEAIAENGYKLFLNNYTCTHFVKNLLSISDSITKKID